MVTETFLGVNKAKTIFVNVKLFPISLSVKNLYKTDFNNWLRGVGWVPIQSLEVEKAKKATDILSEKKYRQHPDKLKYTIDMDAMEQVLAKQNAHTMNKVPAKNEMSIAKFGNVSIMCQG